MKKLIVALFMVFLMSGIATAATTLDFKGQIRVLPEWNNIGRSAGLLPDYIIAQRESESSFFTDQRARLYFNVKSNENLGGTVALEFDSYWGSTSYDNGRGTGGGLGADSSNLELKNAYLWFKAGDLKVTGGVQTWVDEMAGIFAGGADMGGFRADYGLSKTSSLSAGVFTWWQRQLSATNRTWNDSIYFIPITFKQQLGGGSASLFFYTIQDNSNYQALTSATTQGKRPNPLKGTTTTTSTGAVNYNKAGIYYAGLNFGGKAGNLSYYLMGVYNFGTFEDAGATAATSTGDADISAYAASARVEVKIGDGKLKLNGLYVSGTDNDDPNKFKGFVTADQYAGGSSMPLLQNDLVIIINTTDVCTNATSLTSDVNNNGDGLQLAYGAFDYNLSSKLNAKAVVGYAAANEQNLATRSGKSMGTEFNAQLKYKFDENFTITGVGSYAEIGDYYKTSTFDPDSAYKVVLNLTYSF